MAEMTLPIKIAFVMLVLGLMFHLIGFAAPYWHVHEWSVRGQEARLNYGLWRFCHETTRSHRGRHMEICGGMVSGSYAIDYIRATQFFETVGFLAAIISIVFLMLGVCITSCRDRRILPIFSAILALGAAGCIILGCIIFGAKDIERPHLSWAFALAIIGGIFFGIAGVVVLIATLVIKR